MKTLSDLTLEELYELFPIRLVPYETKFESFFHEEKDNLIKLFDSNILFVEHIGSTAIKTILTKPIVDMLLILKKEMDEQRIIEILTKNGYILMSKSIEPLKLSFNKGYTKEGYAEKVFHLHVRYEDMDEVHFRNALINNPNLAKTYESLKLTLLEKYPKDRNMYTKEKTFFVSLITEMEKSKTAFTSNLH